MPRKIAREVTQADLDADPALVEQGVKIGDTMKLPVVARQSIDDEESSEPDQEESTESSDEKIAPVDTVTSKNSISFKVRNNNATGGTSIRTFSKEVHGAMYKDLADEFEAANTHRKVTDSTNADHVQEVRSHNANIKNPVLERIS